MTKRIKELIDQCSEYDEMSMGIWFNKEKFAELIIGHAIECVRDVLRDETSTLSYEDASKVQKCIKEHFGVKE